MSLSKKFCLKNSHSLNERKVESKEDNYRRDSFDDRFCDDLCEEILQYLSLEDKLRLNCVSKQFHRILFKKQYELYIPMRGLEERKIFSNKEYFGFRRVHNYYNFEDQSLDSFKALLKKCPNITSIELDGQHQSNTNFKPDKFNQVFQLIIEITNYELIKRLGEERFDLEFLNSLNKYKFFLLFLLYHVHCLLIFYTFLEKNILDS